MKNNNGQIIYLVIKFDSEDSGREGCRGHPQLAKKYPECTPLKKQIHKYSTSKSAKGAMANVATVQKFPVILSFASTTHKIQCKVAIDLRYVFGLNQAYVMLGRVEEKEQLFIIGELPDRKKQQIKMQKINLN